MLRPMVCAIALLCWASAQAAPLHDAAGDGDVTKVQELIAGGVEIDQEDDLVGTALQKAAMMGQAETARVLIEAGAEVNMAAGIVGLTPLQFAVTKSAGVTAVLIDAGADLAITDPGGNTPLHLAADAGKVNVVRLLLDAGADPDTKNSKGLSPVVFAGAAGHFDIVDLFLERGALAGPPIAPISGLLASADPVRGEQIFESSGCTACHGSKGHAPELRGVVGREKASWPGFDRYTEVLKRVGGTWTYEELNAFIASPARFAPGNWMSQQLLPVPDIPDPADRADIISYLRLQADEPVPLPE
jgi:cytochrome c